MIMALGFGIVFGLAACAGSATLFCIATTAATFAGYDSVRLARAVQLEEKVEGEKT